MFIIAFNDMDIVWLEKWNRLIFGRNMKTVFGKERPKLRRERYAITTESGGKGISNTFGNTFGENRYTCCRY